MKVCVRARTSDRASQRANERACVRAWVHVFVTLIGVDNPAFDQ